MHRTLTIKNILHTVSIGLLVGFFSGLMGAAYHIVVQNYINLKLFRLIIYTLQKWLNAGICTGIAVYLIVITLVVLSWYVPAFCNLSAIRRKIIKLIGTVLIGSGFCAICMYAVWYFILPQQYYYLKVIISYALVIVLTLLVGWSLYKADWKELLARDGSVSSVLAVSVLMIVTLLNLSIFLYDSYYISEKPNIILISIDDLRADHLGCYGYQRNTSPHLDAFARENILFEKAFSHEPWTPPSHLSMLTELYPRTLGFKEWEFMNPKIVTLAEMLKNDGYATFAFSSNIWLTPEGGFGEGFDQFVFPRSNRFSPDDPLREAEYQNKSIIATLQKNKQKSFFAFIHYYDVHSKSKRYPYEAPAPFSDLFTHTIVSDFKGGTDGVYASEYLRKVNREQIKLADKDLQYVVALYDNGIAYMDSCIGEFIRALKDMGMYDNSLIIITADHGEEFQEHGYMLHENPFFYEEIIHVPFLVKLPRGMREAASGRRIHALVELIDIMPSVLECAKIKPLHVLGASFLPLLEGTEKGKEYVYGLSSKKSVYIRSHKWKLLGDDDLNETRFQLYDLENDPHEQRDIITQKAEVKTMLFRKLQERLESSMALQEQIFGKTGGHKQRMGKGLGINEQQKEKLRSLGYIQ
jgi:arylsulfatase